MKITNEEYRSWTASRRDRAAERALDSIKRLRTELDEAARNVVAWRDGEPAVRPEIHSQRYDDAVRDVDRFALEAEHAAEAARLVETDAELADYDETRVV